MVGMWTAGAAAAGRGSKSEESCVSALRTLPGAAHLVAELPLAAAPVIPEHLTMAAARKVADLKRSQVLLVERDGVLAGVIDQHGMLASADDARAGDAMRPLETCLGASTPLASARELFVRTGSAALPVAAGAFLLGVVTRAAVDRALRELERLQLETGRPHARRDRPEAAVLRRRRAA
ncbi:MAG TPA: CBS domain-containing protein [Polyangia bacterium]|nr:CBS domain-containing protein [Polyangia bacterium]